MINTVAANNALFYGNAVCHWLQKTKRIYAFYDQISKIYTINRLNIVGCLTHKI